MTEEAPRDEPQRKRKKRRRRKKNKTTSNNAPIANAQPESASVSPNAKGNATTSPSSPQKARKRNRKTSLAEKLRDFDLLDPEANNVLTQWITMLRQNRQFMTLFQRHKGVDCVVKKVVLQFCEMDMAQEANKRLHANIVKLFDTMLCGTNNYHQWLLDELINLSHQISKQNTNTGSNLVTIISQQAESLVHAQCNLTTNTNDIGIFYLLLLVMNIWNLSIQQIVCVEYKSGGSCSVL